MLILDCELDGTAAKSDMGMLVDSFAEETFCSKSVTLCSKVFMPASSLVRFLTRFLNSTISFDCLNIVQFRHVYRSSNLLNQSQINLNIPEHF